MTAEEADLVKSRMERRIGQLEESIAQLAEDTKPVAPDVSIGRLTRLDAINNKSVAEQTLRDQRSALESLREAHAKFGTADFGKCTRCGAEIQVGRLKFMPESTKCIQCANK